MEQFLGIKKWKYLYAYALALQFTSSFLHKLNVLKIKAKHIGDRLNDSSYRIYLNLCDPWNYKTQDQRRCSNLYWRWVINPVLKLVQNENEAPVLEPMKCV